MTDAQAAQVEDTATGDEVVVDSGSGNEAQADAPEAKSGNVAEDAAAGAASNEVRSLRREAANYRTQARDNKAKAESAEARIAELEDAVAVKDLEIARERIGSELGIPVALRARLQGATADEIRADAESLAGLVVPPSGGVQGTPAGGVNAGAPAEKSVADLAALARAARY